MKFCNHLFGCEMILEQPVVAPEAGPQEKPLFPLRLLGLLGNGCSLPLTPSPPPFLPLGPGFPWLAKTALSRLPPQPEPKPAWPVWEGLGAHPLGSSLGGCLTGAPPHRGGSGLGSRPPGVS